MAQKSSGKAGIGAKLLLSIDGDYLVVANVTTLSAGGVSLNMIDATHLDSPDNYGEFAPGLKSAEEWSFTVQWDTSALTHDDVKGMMRQINGRMLTSMRLDPQPLGLSLGLEASGYFSQVGNIEIAPEAIMTRPVTFRPVGRPLIIDFTNPPTSLNFSDPNASGYLALI